MKKIINEYRGCGNWNGFEFPSIQKVSKFERKNPGITVNVLFSNIKNKYIHTARRIELNGKCKKQVNLLMLVDGEKRHYSNENYIKAIIKIKWKNPAQI